MNITIFNIGTVILLIGIIALVYHLTKIYNTCPQTEIEYRFIPRSFVDEQESMERPTVLYSRMFGDYSTWDNRTIDKPIIAREKKT